MKTFRTAEVLARAFFARLFENDTVPAVPQTQLVIWGIAVLGAPGFLIAIRLGRAYTHAPGLSAAGVFDAILRDQLLYLIYSMIALGLISLLIWEGVFPDRRDARILGVLPISTRTHVAGRLAGLGAFAAMFSVGINLPSAVSYGLVLFVYDAAAGPLRIVVAHLVATAIAGLFAFFLMVLAQGLLLNLFGRTIARRLALAFQSALVVILLQVLFIAPAVGSLVGAAFRNDELSIASFLPPAWFLALYDVLAGMRRPLHPALALLAVVMAVAVMAVATGLIALSYRRLVRIALETPGTHHAGRSKPFDRASHAIATALRIDPVQRAVGEFTLRSLWCSQSHLTLFATCIGLATAVVVATLLPLIGRNGMSALEAPGIMLLAAPLVLSFFLLLGMRALFGIPIEIKANWAFRHHMADNRIHAAVSGARLAVLLAVAAPIAIVAGLVGTTLWGFRTGVIHLGFTAAAGMLLADLALIGLRKVPFACTYYPGRSRAPTLWPVYAAACVTYSYGLAAVEAAAMTNASALLASLASVAALIAILGHLRRRHLQWPPGLVYQESEPGRLFEGFRLSEGLAAESSRQRTIEQPSRWT